ncbi:MAG: radical SAM protein [Asgard group archaeon]|nr:radical SAM protein [Asgard group archaeon]
MALVTANLNKKKCSLCEKKSIEISEKLGVCKECLIDNTKEAMLIITKKRLIYRKEFNLPLSPPKTKGGINCGDCVNNCVLGENEFGFCNLVKNEKGQLIRIAGDVSKGFFSFYYDPLPTNCVAAPFCAGCTSNGYPHYSYVNGPEIGYNNLAVFYQSCTFDCLYCQNYQYRKGVHLSKPSSPNTLIDAIKPKTSCICFFGGDPASQIRHSNKVGHLALEKAFREKRIIRVCWETNGSAKPALMEDTTGIALFSGGTIKIDVKSYDDILTKALCGSSNKYTLQNLNEIGSYLDQRPESPLLIASTLLVPGYIDVDQVRKIAKFLVDINPKIPYSLLAFYPTFVIDDLPTTSATHAKECLNAAKDEGLTNVWIGNSHLLRET